MPMLKHAGTRKASIKSNPAGFWVVLALAGLAALSITAGFAHAHQHHDHAHAHAHAYAHAHAHDHDHGHDHDHDHDPTSAAHVTSRLWNPTTRGSLVALDLDHTGFTALYYDTKTESVRSWSTPVCLIDRGVHDQKSGGVTLPRFSLCPLGLNPWPTKDQGPGVGADDATDWTDVYDGETGHAVRGFSIRTFDQPGVGQVYTNLLDAYESQSIFPNKTSSADSTGEPDPALLAIKLSLPLSRNDLKQAGIADIRSFWRLTPRPLHSRHLVTATQVFTIYLALILRHTSSLISSSSPSLSPTSARISGIIPIVPGGWPAYQSSGPQDTSPLSSLLRSLPAFDSRPPSVFRTLARPLATVHGAQMDQLAECLHRSLRVLVVHKERHHGFFENNYKHQLNVVNVPLSDFLSVEDGPKFGVWLNVLEKGVMKDWIKEDMTHLVLTGNGWRQPHVDQLSSLLPDAQVWPAATATGQTGWMGAPYLSAAATVLDQQYSPCSCGKRDSMVVRCDLMTRAEASHRIVKGVSETPQVIAASASSSAPLALPALPFVDEAAYFDAVVPFAEAPTTVIDFYARHFLTGGWMYLGRQSNTSTVGVHERGWDFTGADGVGRCIPRADPRDLQQRKHISKHRVAMGVPPAWAQTVCLSPYHVPGRVAGLRENRVEMAVVEWWVVDKRWFAPDLGKEDGTGRGKSGP